MDLDMRPRWLLVLGAVSAFAVVGYVVWHDPELGMTCPSGDVSVPADAVHIAPTLVQHQNWVDVDQPGAQNGEVWVYACVDGRLIGRKPVRQMDFDPATGMGEVKILTRWVDLTWLTGDLDQYRDPGRWTVVYARAS